MGAVGSGSGSGGVGSGSEGVGSGSVEVGSGSEEVGSGSEEVGSGSPEVDSEWLGSDSVEAGSEEVGVSGAVPVTLPEVVPEISDVPGFVVLPGRVTVALLLSGVRLLSPVGRELSAEKVGDDVVCEEVG